MSLATGLRFIFVLLFAIGCLPAFAGEKSPITVDHDHELFRCSITIRSAEGRVAWAQVLRGMARAKGFDDAALDGVLPGGTFSITGISSRLQLATYNVLLKPHVRLDVFQQSEDRPPDLVITLNREALLASQRRMKSWLREKSLAVLSRRSRSPSRRDFGIQLDDGWSRRRGDKNLVVLVHGLNSNSYCTDPLLAGPRESRFPCGTFNYPNDQPISKSADLLSRELRGLSKRYPRLRITLLTHSMGGLVARATIENDKLDPGNVEQLIMVAPPNHGSRLAHFAFGLDLWEYVAGAERRNRARILYGAIEDGFAEASVDLQPDSHFLRKLNARSRNPRVDYTIFVGTQAPLNDAELGVMRSKLAKAGDRNRWIKFFGSRLDPWLADLDEVVDQRGDGAVAVRRAQLDGVDDTVKLDFGHEEVLTTRPSGAVADLHREILARLQPNPKPR